MHPFVEHLRGVEAIEKDRWTAADKAFQDAQQELESAQARFREAEISRAVAEARLLAVRENVSSAEEALSTTAPPPPETGDEPAEAPRQTPQQPHHDQPGTHEAPTTAGSRSIEKLIIEALASGDEVPLSAITAHVQRHRPGSDRKQIRSAASRLRGKGKIAKPRRGIYRLHSEGPRT
ncbi:hypothetical protein [Streptomyces sp. Ag109_G2-6]|uniref:hypothetical protein n=1 Tax=Streptomyces sp. Ag109_G2-6 TaxID=2485154 RepID=UPI000F4DCBDD|nr:hypothetical protein [Streptomyces sp. Ag109_G2-6]